MGKKCCIPGCKSNYVATKKEGKIEKSHIKVFRLPRKIDDLERWKKNLPYKNLDFNKNTVICVKHWPENYAVRGKGHHERPAEPPSVWPGVPRSCVPTPLPPPRPTQRTSLTVRAAQPCQLDNFLAMDNVTFSGKRWYTSIFD